MDEEMDRYIADISSRKSPSDEHWLMPLTYIILSMCRAKKNRIVDHCKLRTKQYWNQKKLDMPDYAIDRHTTQGNKSGLKKNTKKGSIHFEKVSAKLENKVDVEGQEFWWKGYLKNRGLTEEDLED